MTNPDDPAFPLDLRNAKDLDHVMHICPGLTKREYFAGKALEGIASGISSIVSTDIDHLSKMWDNIPGTALEMADKLIKELNK